MTERNLIDLLGDTHISPETHKQKQIEDLQIRMLEEFCSTSKLQSERNKYYDEQFKLFFDKYENPQDTKLSNEDIKPFLPENNNKQTSTNNDGDDLRLQENDVKLKLNDNVVNEIGCTNGGLNAFLQKPKTNRPTDTLTFINNNITPRILIPKLKSSFFEQDRKECHEDALNEDLIEEVLFEQQLEKQTKKAKEKVKEEQCTEKIKVERFAKAHTSGIAQSTPHKEFKAHSSEIAQSTPHKEFKVHTSGIAQSSPHKEFKTQTSVIAQSTPHKEFKAYKSGITQSTSHKEFKAYTSGNAQSTPHKDSDNIFDEIVEKTQVNYFGTHKTIDIDTSIKKLYNSTEKALKTKQEQKELTEELVTKYDVKYLEAVKKVDKAFRLSSLKPELAKAGLTPAPSLYEKSMVLPHIMQRLRERQKAIEEADSFEKRLILDVGLSNMTVKPTSNMHESPRPHLTNTKNSPVHKPTLNFQNMSRSQPSNITNSAEVLKPTLNLHEVPGPELLKADCNRERLIAFESGKLFSDYVYTGTFFKK